MKCLFSGTERDLCTCDGCNGDRTTTEDIIARRRVERAGPDLLAALKMARGYVVERIDRGNPNVFGDVNRQLEEIDAAIAKAEGR